MTGCYDMRANRRYVILLLAFVCLLIWALLTHGFSRFILIKAGDQVYIKDSGQRYLAALGNRPVMSQMESMELVLPGNYEARFPRFDEKDRKVVFLRSGRIYHTISLRELRDKFLRDESQLGGHEAANELRWVNRRDGLSLYITNAQRVGEHVLALLSWVDESGSLDNVVRKDLVLVYAGAMPRIELARHLDYRNYEDFVFANSVMPRIFMIQDKLLLYDSNCLEEIDQEGEKIRIYVKIRNDQVPVGLLDRRWLILCYHDFINEENLRFWYMDLRRRWIARAIPRE